MGSGETWNNPEFQFGNDRTGRQAKIIGGNIAEPNEFPHQVHLTYNGNMVCGGTIINTIIILTAAHCVKFKNPNRFKVTGGDHHRHYFEGTEQERNVSHIFMHEEYDWDTDRNDIALMVLSEPFEFNEFVKSISYAKNKAQFVGRAMVSGWGKTKEDSLGQSEPGSDILKKVSVPIVPQSECRRNYLRTKMRILDQMMCAGSAGQDSCQGDSGGPVICTDKRSSETVLCGIVSHGIGCGRKGYPGVNTAVSHYSQWIERTIQKYETRGKCSTSRFYCSENNSCIDRKFICDETNNCPAGSDEKNCKAFRSSPRGHFRCSNGLSIKASWVCDSMDDCGDHSDEDKCDFRGKNGTCHKSQFSCVQDGRCINSNWQCDGLIDCNDGSDEARCGNKDNDIFESSLEVTSTPPTTSYSTALRPTNTTENVTCRSGLFQCLSKHCIPLIWKCDGDIDCPTGDDEVGCDLSIVTPTTPSSTTTARHPSTTRDPVPYFYEMTIRSTRTTPQPTPSSTPSASTRNPCTQVQFHCPGNRRGYCIPIEFKCDGDDDCLAGEDEANCERKPSTYATVSTLLSIPNRPSTLPRSSTTTQRPSQRRKCSSRQFQCRNGDCISNIFVCDGDNDCDDRSDEDGCRSSSSTCSPYQWRCNNGDCIYHRYRCDNDVDCTDGSDEEGCSLQTYLALIDSVD